MALEHGDAPGERTRHAARARSATYVTRDLAENVPAQSLIAKLLTEWDAGRIRLGERPDEVVIDDESRGWFWGVLGERKVAAVLGTLGPDTQVLHSIPIGAQGADVDHLVITPSGIFTINTKYHPGAQVWTAGHGLLVNSVSQARYLRASVREARRVEEKLSAAADFAVPVYPVIVFVDAARFQQKAANVVDGVHVRVTTARDLPHVIRIRRELSDEQTARIAQVARMPSTWLKTTRPTIPGAHLAREFDALYAALGPSLDPAVRSPRRPAAAPTRAASKSNAGARLLVGCLGLLLIPIALFLVSQLFVAALGAALSH